MPYSGPGDDKLPGNIKKLPAKQRRQWVAVFNSAQSKCQEDGGKDCEGAAFARANGVMKKEEEPEADALDTKMEDYISPMATSFADLEAAEQAHEETERVREMAHKFGKLTDNIMYNPDVPDKTSALASLVNEFASKIGNAMRGSGDKERWQPLTNKVADILDGKPEPEEAPDTEPKTKEQDTSTLLFFKDTETGRIRWAATYSNNYRDQDNPPEIISQASHQSFISKAMAGDVPMPELWLWHVPGSAWGVADHLAWDDRGFAVATGLVDAGKEWVADSLPIELQVSHGMPLDSIRRDKDDQTIIVEHITKEISPLPIGRAANKLTGFQIIKKEETMPFTDQDREKLGQMGIDPDQLEADNAAKAAAATAEALESKDTTEVDEPEPDTMPEPQTQPPAQPEPTSEYVTRTEVEELAETIAAGQKALTDAVKALSKSIAAVKRDDEAKIKETLANTPAASLASHFRSVIGQEPAKLDGRTSLAKGGPEEANPQAQQKGIPFINNIMAGQRGSGRQ